MTILLAGWLSACGPSTAPTPSPTAVPDAEIEAVSAEQTDGLYLELTNLRTSDWVRQYDPRAASSGYNLLLYRRRLPILTDMNGRLVHSWPMVRAVSRARLSRQGRLLVIARQNRVEEYDWDGKLTWSFDLPRKDLTHHDLIQLANGNYLVLAADHTIRRNYLTEVDGQRNIVWKWWAQLHLNEFPGWDPTIRDPAHLNSINELPENRWFNAGDVRFRPGNILVRARNLHTIFIVDRLSGEVVWRYSDGLDSQHEAIMVEKGRPGAGLITVFNNGLKNLHAYRRSSVEAINPVRSKVIWKYSSQYFFSSTGGTSRRLEGGTTLITSTHGGRVFEVDRRGRIVWELVPPGQLGRAERVSYDHCPQLESLPRPEETGVTPEHWGPYVDADLYTFEPGNHFGRKRVAKKRRKLMPWGNACRELLFPPGASLAIGCGIVKKELEGERVSARFRLSIRPEGGPREHLIDVSIDESSGNPWLWFHLQLHRFGYKRVELCVATEVEGTMANPEEVVAWAHPIIKSKWQTAELLGAFSRIDRAEKELRKQQLEALGYIE
jgi:hypothetical protein